VVVVKVYAHTHYPAFYSDSPRTLFCGEYEDVESYTSLITESNKWSVTTDAIAVPDGIVLVSHQVWTFLEVSVRARKIESVTLVTHLPLSDVIDMQWFTARLMLSVNDNEELNEKRKRFKSAGMPLEGRYCDEYEPSIRHVSSCNVCSAQFIKHNNSLENQRYMEERETKRKNNRAAKARKRGGKPSKPRVYVRGENKYKKSKRYAFALSDPV